MVELHKLPSRSMDANYRYRKLVRTLSGNLFGDTPHLKHHIYVIVFASGDPIKSQISPSLCLWPSYLERDTEISGGDWYSHLSCYYCRWLLTRTMAGILHGSVLDLVEYIKHSAVQCSAMTRKKFLIKRKVLWLLM